ncbi:MAG TPA: hypothetical protein VJR48_02900, partial [Ktedonobacterales bacterium]|nr:hypothetical protein [Ktedonobacterales bacterium]
KHLLDDGEVDGDGQAILRALADAHTRHAAWCEQRAREFAETRLLDFRRPSTNLPPGAAESDPLSDISGEHSSPRTAAPVLAEPGMDNGVEDTADERESPPVE